MRSIASNAALLLCLLAFAVPGLAQCPGRDCPSPQSQPSPAAAPLQVASDCPGKGCPKGDQPAAAKKAAKPKAKKVEKKTSSDMCRGPGCPQ